MVRVAAFWEKWGDVDRDLQSCKAIPGVRSAAGAARHMAPDYIRGFDPRQRDVAWSMPEGELGLRNRLPQGRPRWGGVQQGRRKWGDKGVAVSGGAGQG